MNILVTGALGFVGSYLLRHWQGQHHIYALTRRLDGVPQMAGVQWIQQDLAAELDIAHLPHSIDAVVHLAQSRHYRQFPEKATDIFDVNIHSTLRLLEYARTSGAHSFILASTGGVYRPSFSPVDEHTQAEPGNFYTVSKYAAEMLAQSYQAFFTPVLLRFFFVYGAGQKGMLMPNLVGRVMRGEVVSIDGEPGLCINPIHVCDMVRVFDPALTLSSPDTINVAGDERVTITELVRLIGDVVNKTPVIQYTGKPLDGDLVADNTRMKKTLSVVPQVTLKQGLQEMAAEQ